ncbi:MAG TPA: chromosome segregation protein SMC [Pyrinomonadaceae bacterium]|jgi:chromosome segregation protein
MFKLQRLEITGFKSFADHTELVFTGEGITAVVGPNGCGKSNVADAIAWVLGEQKIKNLRGAEMKDVIFQGSRNRQPSGMAEVVLHMVRDETIEHEPDIDDIDSTLEEIDDHAVRLEDLNVAGEAADAVAIEPASLSFPAGEPAAEGMPAAVETGERTGHEELTPEQATGADAAAAGGDAPAEASTGAPEAGGDSLDLSDDAADAASAAPESAAMKLAHKRRWRPSRLALEFAPGEAVSVTRRLYRSGESEYLLNNRACRLRDIQDLFSGTGLSGAHYAIIEQGRIGQILSAKPMDRRTLIEEAAGITKFRVRQRAAEARLESARANLSRVSDIISEIDRQVNSLRRQAAKARRYRILREELRELLRGVFVAEERSLAQLLEETRVRLEEVAREERALVEELAAGEDDARSATQEARSLEEELAETRAAIAEAELQRDRRLRERSYQEEQAVALEERRAAVESEIEAVRVRLGRVGEECERLRRQDAELRSESEEHALVLQSAETAYGRRVLEVIEAEAEVERARAELLTHTGIAERLMEIGRQLEAALERLALQAEGLAREGERAAAIHAERITESETLNREIGVARESLARLIAEREAAVHTVVLGHEAVSEADAELTRARDEFSRVHHRLDTLLELDLRHAHYSPAVQRLFSAGDAPEEFHFMGTLADMLNVEPRWERAVEGALGSSLQAIIVPTPDDAARAALWLREHDAGRASFLVAGLHGASEETDTAAYRAEAAASGPPANDDADVTELRIHQLLGAPRELLAVLNRTIPQRMNARIASSLDHAMTMSLATGEMCVTTEGDWVTGGQLVNAGDERALEEGAGLLAFKRELRELETRSQELEAEMLVAERAVAEARARLGELEDGVVLLNEAIGREERDAMARELNAAQLLQEIERAERHLRVVADDAARLAQERLELEERRATALTEAEAADTSRLAASEMVAEAASRLAIARRAAETESEGLGEQRAAAAAAAERRRATAAELRRMEAERGDLDERLERMEREVAESASRLAELRRSIEEMEQGAESVEEERAREDELIGAKAARLAQARERADALSAALGELNRRAAAAREMRASLEVQRAEATARLGYVRETCMSELNQSLEDLSRERPADEEFDLEAGRARVEELRARVEGFGAVNMMALEELAEAEERLLFLTGQRQDITEGIASTEEALREIKRRSRERFRHAFEQINRNFSEFFLELFGGGRGEMSLIEADDVLESGIDIVAQPPGKRLQNVLLLSGGEKAMAALALVLGIFHYRPSPFCLLDEVDAPLDEANVGRFTDKIAQMSANTQFIVITHNKRTMEMARALYGVTMEEVGVSKMVSVRFE